MICCNQKSAECNKLCNKNNDCNKQKNPIDRKKPYFCKNKCKNRHKKIEQTIKSILVYIPIKSEFIISMFIVQKKRSA